MPDFQSLMLPLLEIASDGKEHPLREARETLATRFNLTEEERNALLPSGRQAVFVNRVAWAKVYLQQAGALESTRRGHFRISDRGREVLQEGLERITVKYLDRFPEFVQFRSATKKEKGPGVTTEVAEEGQTPEEVLEAAHQRLRDDLISELLGNVENCSWQFFERLVVEVLLRMGYGGSREEAGKAIGKTGDEGVDGIIKEDRLGLDVIYLQAKKWKGTVGRPEIQKFVGALQGKRAKKGIFIATGGFSAEAIDYVTRIEPRVVLMDGSQLAEMMIEFNVGVVPTGSYETKRIDSDYFSED
jgi:restriction system protein